MSHTSTAAPTTHAEPTHHQLIPGVPTRQLMSASVSNLIEWYDWNAYAFLSVYFSKLFFPANTAPLVSLLGTFGIMAVGFLMRPLAGLIIGSMADHLGRRPALYFTVFGMAFAALVIAICPTYAKIGVGAPIILLLARIVQGLCIGGSYSSMSAFAMEMAPEGKRGTVASMLYLISLLGQLLVIGLVVLFTWVMTPTQMSSYGWRIVFGIGAVLSFAGIFVLRDMQETLPPRDRAKTGLLAPMRHHPRQTLLVVGMTIGFTAMVYAWGSYMPTYAKTYKGMDPKYGMTAMLITTVATMIFAPLNGWLSDRFGRRMTMGLAGLLLTVGTVPALRLLTGSVLSLILVQAFGQVVLGQLQSSSMPAYSELFPPEFRAAGLGFPYSLTVGLIGGTVPMVATQLARSGHGHLFPWYLSILMAISTITYFAMRETAFDPLPTSASDVPPEEFAGELFPEGV